MSARKRCDCLAKMDEQLAPMNARVATGIKISQDMSKVGTCILIGVEKIDSRKRKRLPNVIATFCPFCGQKLS